MLYLVQVPGCSVHIHVICIVDYRPAEEQQGWMSYLGKALATPASILPTTVSIGIMFSQHDVIFSPQF